MTDYDLLNKIRIGMTREQVKQALGEPDDISIGTRKYPTPGIYKYGTIELHFLPWKSGTLVAVLETKDEPELPPEYLLGKL